MSKVLKAAVAAMAALALACNGSDFIKQDQFENVTQFQGTFTLQGKVMNALTGEALGGDDLKMKLIQGTAMRDPDRLIKESKDAFVGEYAFGNIPLSMADNTAFKLVVIKDGFQRFEGIIDFTANYYGDFVDTVYNYVGDVYLFPVGTAAPAYTVNVTYEGKPVPNATVRLDPRSNSFLLQTSYYDLSNNAGYQGVLTATTDAEGKATFAGESLVLGGTYGVSVLPVTFEGVQLASYDGSNFSVGYQYSPTQIPVALTSLAPGSAAYGLYITQVSNQAGALDADGTLVIKFSRAVHVSDLTNGFTAYVSNTSGTTAGTLNTPTVLATLTDGGKTLTLKANWATKPAADEIGAFVAYSSGATIGVEGYADTAFQLFGYGGIPRIDGSYLGYSEQVFVTAR